MKIDLNADLGEGCASDAELLTLVSSANIACGFHAGDAQIMQACVREAIKNGVAIGGNTHFLSRLPTFSPFLPPRSQRLLNRRCIKLARWQRLPVRKAA